MIASQDDRNRSLETNQQLSQDCTTPGFASLNVSTDAGSD